MSYLYFFIKIENVDGSRISVKGSEIFKPFPRIILFQCILKKNAMEIAIQKTAEIGISSIVPVFSRRVILDKKRLDNKVGRWDVIAMQASK
ncbi:MAG: 16S rRNA (uracil(1498)-N(3))-methyltransferase [Actinobacteria bacterium]|nr:16S rRNA (uracil(1498)-N(3))-methyltransferase [Actinomycetota bacterium]